MANYVAKDGNAALQSFKSTGAGSDADPFVPGKTIVGPLGRTADAASVSTALSTEDAALLSALLTQSDFDTKIGSLTEAAPGTDTASSGLNGRLQRIAQRLTSLIGLFPTALGSSTAANSFPVTLSTDGPFVTQTGSITETAPATDTASSGLNGRLQRIAQNLTTLFGRFVAAATLADSTALPSTTIVGGAGMLYNATTLDLWRNNHPITVLSSAVRAASNNAAQQTCYNARGMIVFVSITAVPGTDTVTFGWTAKGPVTGTYDTNIGAASGALATNGVRSYLFYPGAVTNNAYTTVYNGPVPRDWRIEVTHSAASNFTYSVSVQYIM